MDENKSEVKNREKQEEEALNEYPGEATDVADDDKVDARLTKQETDELNNNPQNNGKII